MSVRTIPAGPVGGDAFRGNYPNIEYPGGGGIYFGDFDYANPPLGMVKYVRRLSNSEILNCVTEFSNNGGYVLVPDLGPERVASFVRGIVLAQLVDGDYTNLDAGVDISITTSAGNGGLTTDMNGGLLVAGDSGKFQYASCALRSGQGEPLARYAGIPIQVYATNGMLGDFTGGGPNNYLEFQIWVEVIDVS